MIMRFLGESTNVALEKSGDCTTAVIRIYVVETSTKQSLCPPCLMTCGGGCVSYVMRHPGLHWERLYTYLENKRSITKHCIRLLLNRHRTSIVELPASSSMRAGQCTSARKRLGEVAHVFLFYCFSNITTYCGRLAYWYSKSALRTDQYHLL